MKKITILITALLLVSVLLGAQEAPAVEKSWLLAMKSDKDLRFNVEGNLQARTRMAMMFMPEQEVFMQLFVSKEMLMKASGSDGRYESESKVATATLEHYLAGQPNQKMPDEAVEELLWSSGIGGKNVTIKGIHDARGGIVEIHGVPEKYLPYFKNDLVHFSDKPVKVGESWRNSFDHPLAFDPHQEPVICKVDVVYTLEKVSEDEKEAEVSFLMKTASDHIMQNGQKVPAVMKLDRKGTMKLRLANCVPYKITSTTDFAVEFSSTSYIKSEEIYDTVLQFVEPAEKSEEQSN